MKSDKAVRRSGQKKLEIVLTMDINGDQSKIKVLLSFNMDSKQFPLSNKL